jgi:non-specific serine/threonine protein kinase/serine/threonine-protein kinase
MAQPCQETHRRQETVMSVPDPPTVPARDDSVPASTPNFDGPAPPDCQVTAAPPEPIGPYHLLEVLGQGGMGIVYLAEQKAPVRRRVALKLIKLGMDTHEVVTRFQAERQALALLNHPNIARVFDAGATAQGRPYFVMEYVPGIPITRYCDQLQLGVRERVELFLPVCEAVQHAHQKGIIHRDLKPSNVLVMVQDDHPVPKVIDFGLVKVTAGEGTDRSLYTRHGQILGTPAYMSPEQAEAIDLDIDTRTDVYSLGAVLYELLVGAAPFDPLTLQSVGYSEMQRILREVQPPRPSTRISSLGGQSPDVAHKRHAEPRALARQLRGDLDWIALKAMDKDRTRRYATPLELAADLRRYLNGEPVLACPPSVGYRLRKFAGKHKGAVTAVAAVLLALVGGLVATTWLYLEAGAARRLAERHRREAEAINDFLVQDMMASAKPDRARGRPIPVEEVLANAAARIERAFPDQPEAEARLRHTLGHVYVSLGLGAKAEPHLRRALELYRRVHGPDSAAGLGALNSLVSALAVQAGPEKRSEARALSDECLAACRRVRGEDDPVTLEALHGAAGLLSQDGQYAEAERLYRRVLDGRLRVLGEEHRATLAARNSLAAELLLQEKSAEAEQLYRQTLDACRRAFGPNHPDTLSVLDNLAWVLGRQPGKLAEAVPLARQALSGRRQVLGSEHWQTLASLNTVATLLDHQGELPPAEELYRELAETSRRVLGREHALTLTAMNNRARTLVKMGRWQEAEALLRETRDLRSQALGPGHPSTLSTRNNLAHLLHGRGRLAETEAEYRQVVAFRPPASDPATPTVLFAMHGLASVLLDRGQPCPDQRAEAEALCRTVVAARRPRAATAPRPLANALETLGRVLLEKGEIAPAKEALEEAVALYAAAPSPDDWDAAYARSVLGQCLAAAGQLDKAEPLLVAACETLQRIPSTPPQRTRQALERVVRLYEAWKKPAEAAAWRRKLEQAGPPLW